MHLTLVIGLMGLSWAIARTHAAEPPGALEIRSLSLKDASGRVRLSLQVTEKDQVEMKFFDGEGKTRILIGHSGDGMPAVVLADAKGSPRAGLHLGSDGSPCLRFLDPAQQTRLMLCFDQDLDSAGIHLCSRGPEGALMLAAHANGTAALTLVDREGRMRANVGVEKTGRPFVSLNGSDEEERVGLAVDGGAAGVLRVGEGEGGIGVEIGSLRDRKSVLAARSGANAQFTIDLDAPSGFRLRQSGAAGRTDWELPPR
ncbi:MAG: hypothetical protein ACT4PV_14005 [Planctomycetaceae bacterium]